jgi:type IV pilus assembly protein PilA
MFKSIKKRLKNQRGLTLVELLAVVVILGIIAAIAVPNIGKLISKTEDDAKVAEGIQIINAAKIYANSSKLTFNASDAATLTETQLASYLDNLKDGTFTVTVKKVSGKYQYSLSNHSSLDLVDKADWDDPDTTEITNVKDGKVTEAELLAY